MASYVFGLGVGVTTLIVGLFRNDCTVVDSW